MHSTSDEVPSSPFHKAAKSIGLAVFTLMALAVTQPEFPARVYEWIIALDLLLLSLL